LLSALTAFLKANDLKADWEGIEKAPNEALVNALSMMSPYGTAEKQALLEAPDLKTRAEVLIAITEIELAKKNTEGEPQLQYLFLGAPVNARPIPRTAAPSPGRQAVANSPAVL